MIVVRHASSEGKCTATRRVPRVVGGFTLVEVIVVLTVLGILAGFAMPRIDVDRFRSRAGAQEVSTTIAAAQGSAVLRGHEIALVFDADARAIRIHSDVDSDGTLEADEPRRLYELPEGVVFGRGGAAARPISGAPVSFENGPSGDPVLTFYRNASASEEGVVYVTSAGDATEGADGRDTRAIEVHRSTGRVRCFSHRTGSWEEGC